ncbi:squalene--hopene cyclase [Candidatus Methylacidiphilum infernorum]|uniref:Squalene--hopene cyclase n=1 Tax=Candidatus Methylacidiphilum infernorum TaxID=511746 RepID=A0ABX7PTR4_9BACT|nr:squalene--hopene cyclase [Candidatus Methylacidiphilum infernorum]
MHSGRVFLEKENREENRATFHSSPLILVEESLNLPKKVEETIKKAQSYLLSIQKEDGHWVGELFVDVTLACDCIHLMHWRGKIDYKKQLRLVKHIVDRQLPDGGWNIYPGGPSEVNATVKAYFALKLAGFSPDDPLMAKARSTILRLGGIPKCMTYTKLGLALLGVYPWDRLPVIPPEIILFPNWFPFNIYEISAWSRAMLVPLSVIHHFKPTRNLPEKYQLHELFPYGTEHGKFSWLKKGARYLSKQGLFLACDKFLQYWDKTSLKPFRKMALKKAEKWILERISAGSDGLGAIFPAMHYAIMALIAMGYTEDNPILKKAIADFEGLEVDDKKHDDLRIQPCLSPVWDTAVSLVALAESGVARNAKELKKAAYWLLDREVKIKGDWYVRNPHPEPSGWAFEYNNVYYPDVDDTLMVLLALRLIDIEDKIRKEEVMQRALRWVISFQCKNGGWAAFDKDVYKKWLEDIPFADHNAILDPPCSDITARALELFGKMGIKKTERFVQKAIAYLKETQENDGSWMGRWGVNYIYGTWQALRGLQAIGENMNQEWILRARDWLESCQNEDGGWGETPASYDNPQLKGKGPSTASQTAWAVSGIMACGDIFRPSVTRGIKYLCDRQLPDGSWAEEFLTGTGFPGVFYLKYDMYRNAWPLLVIGEYHRQYLKAKEQVSYWVDGTIGRKLKKERLPEI